jgi:serine/threonine protein kinase
VSANVREVLAIIASAVKPPKYPTGLSAECYSFLDNCLQIDPEVRATAEQLLQHPFITGVAAPSQELQSLLRNTTITNHILPTPPNDPEDREEVHIVVPRISLTTKFHSPIVQQVAEELKEEMQAQGKAYREQFSTNAI